MIDVTKYSPMASEVGADESLCDQISGDDDFDLRSEIGFAKSRAQCARPV